MTDFSYVTVSKGRLGHLKQTLPHMVAPGTHDVIVVDYACPEGTGDWVEATYPGVRVVRVEDGIHFCLARARNFGAELVETEWIVFVDADIFPHPEWHQWIGQNVERGKFYRAGPIAGKMDHETWGTCIISRADFLAVGGYDEVFRGWGGEDNDLYVRLALKGVEECFFPGEFVSPIRHGDELRADFNGLRSKKEVVALHKCYSLAKRGLIEQLGIEGDLPLEYRKYIMMDLHLSLIDWFKGGGGLSFTVKTRILHDNIPYLITVEYNG